MVQFYVSSNSPAMSALGQKQTYAPQKAHVRFTPNSARESGHPVVDYRPARAGHSRRAFCAGPKKQLLVVVLDQSRTGKAE